MVVRQNNRMRLRVEGIEELVAMLRNADKEIQRELNDLVSECAEIVFREADARVPIGTTNRTRNSLRIEVGKNNKGIFYANVVVGAYDNDTTATSAFYVSFYELGSSHQPPRPFLRPAYDKSKAKMRKHLIEGLERIILGLGS